MPRLPRPEIPFRLRPATSQDLPAIVELAVDMVVHSVSPYRDSTPEMVRAYRRDDLRTLQDALVMDRARVLVAEAPDGSLLGHIVVLAGQVDSSTGEAQGWIFDVSVRHDTWGKGVGRTLVAAAEEFVAERGLARIGLGVTSANARAVRFYEELGYLEERKQMIKKL